MASKNVPSLVSGINVYALPLSTKEGFVLSRVDGSSSVEDISIMVGIKKDELVGILERLAELGAVRLSWLQANNGGAGKGPMQSGNRVQPSAARAPAVFEKPRYAPHEVEEVAQVSLEVKKRILQAFYSLESQNYYESLGVAQTAEKKEIRSAYFELSKVFHPDSLFGKELGSFKPKMETVFKRLTEAYEALGRNAKRKEYDEYLAATQTTTAIRETLEHVPPIQIEQIREAPTPRPTGQIRVEPRRAMMPPASEESRVVEPLNLRPPSSPDERKARARERLQRHLGSEAPASSVPPKPVSSIPPTNETAEERRTSVIKGLRESLRSVGRSKDGTDPMLGHLKRAKEAEMAGDLLGAASALQSALTLDPTHLEINEQYARVSKAVSRSLAENYEKQARYEEKMGKWPAAAASWARVTDGRPEDAGAARCAADALLKAGGDLHLAQRYAQRAVDLAPSEVGSVVVLARIFLAVGLRLNARRELEKAVKLDPQDEMIKNLLLETR